MAQQQLVRVANVARDQSVDSQHLREGGPRDAKGRVAAAWTVGGTMDSDSSSTGEAAAPPPAVALPSPRSMPKGALQRLLFGSPFSERTNGIDPAVEQLDCLIDELIELLRIEHGESVAFKQAERELSEVRSMPVTTDRGVCCKRAMLLFAIWRDEDVAARFRHSDAALLAHLEANVLPIVGPKYLSNLGQRPDSFVLLCNVLVSMWLNQPLCFEIDAAAAAGGVGGVGAVEG